jgi:hypothetical protein
METGILKVSIGKGKCGRMRGKSHLYLVGGIQVLCQIVMMRQKQYDSLDS